MRLFLLATLLALIATACAEKDYMLVRRMNRDITQAINIFCGTTEDMVVPSMQTELGATSRSGYVVARIRGDCSPAQWVPRMFCIDQLNHVSAESFRNGGDGSGQKKYGKDGCQNFVVAFAGGKLLG